MKRYEPARKSAEYPDMVKHPDGEWVRFDDVAAELAHLRITYENTLDTQRRALRQFEVANKAIAMARVPADIKGRCGRASKRWQRSRCEVGVDAPRRSISLRTHLDVRDTYGYN
jgi:hypothetical protein